MISNAHARDGNVGESQSGWMDALAASSVLVVAVALHAWLWNFNTHWRGAVGLPIENRNPDYPEYVYIGAVIGCILVLPVLHFTRRLSLRYLWPLGLGVLTAWWAIALSLADILSMAPEARSLARVSLRLLIGLLHVLGPALIGYLGWARGRLFLIALFLALCRNTVARLSDNWLNTQMIHFADLPLFDRIPLFLNSYATNAIETITMCCWGQFWVRITRGSVPWLSGLTLLYALSISAVKYAVSEPWRPIISVYFINELVGFAILIVVLTYLYRSERTAELIGLHASTIENAQRAAKESQLSALKAQIEPHFLFNTLATVKRLYATTPVDAKGLLGAVNRYCTMVTADAQNPQHTLAKELDLVRNYLAILQARMGQRLHYSVISTADVEALNLSATPVPAMSLLTLVENAIKHGITPKPEGGTIAVTVSADADTIALNVADSGIGFSFATQGGTGVGLANVRARLHAHYGADATLRLHTNAQRGVSATLTIPRP
jgi:signal transduction histidine kinase